MNAFIIGERLSYGMRGRALVSDASLAIHTGQFTVIVGPNGAGKSTLLKLLTGELSATSGSLRYAGEPLAAIPPWRLASLRAVMAQTTRLAFPFTVHDAARIGVEGIGRSLTRQQRTAIIAHALATADVIYLADRPLQLLSGGEQQRAHFARVLCQLEAGRSIAPRQALFLDEPIASLDLRHQLALMDAALAIARSGASVLAVLHDLNIAVTYADQLIVMKEGRLIAAGPPAAILDRALVKTVFEVDVLRSHPDFALPFVLPQARAGVLSP